MRNALKMVKRIIVERQIDFKDANEVIEFNSVREEKEENRSRGKWSLLHSLSVIVLHVLDALLLVVLLPYMIWQWVYGSDRLKIILRAVVEVTLELFMWVIFAGVSILMTATFVLEDIYFGKNDTEKLKQLLNARNETVSSDKGKTTTILETQNHLKEKEKLKIPNNRD